METLHHCDAPEEPRSIGDLTPGTAAALLGNERGIALITALMLALISLTIASAVLYLLMMQSKASGAHKRYKTSLEAAHGGVQLITSGLIPAMFDPAKSVTSLEAEFASVQLDLSADSCLRQKLDGPSSGWSACQAASQSNDPKQMPDMAFRLPGVNGPGYKVYAKIVDATKGNSDTSGIVLDSAAAVTGSSPGVKVKHVPALYRIETEGESIANTKEKASLTVFYSY